MQTTTGKSANSWRRDCLSREEAAAWQLLVKLVAAISWVAVAVAFDLLNSSRSSQSAANEIYLVEHQEMLIMKHLNEFNCVNNCRNARSKGRPHSALQTIPSKMSASAMIRYLNGLAYRYTSPSPSPPPSQSHGASC